MSVHYKNLWDEYKNLLPLDEFTWRDLQAVCGKRRETICAALEFAREAGWLSVRYEASNSPNGTPRLRAIYRRKA